MTGISGIAWSFHSILTLCKSIKLDLDFVTSQFIQDKRQVKDTELNKAVRINKGKRRIKCVKMTNNCTIRFDDAQYNLY